MHAFFFVEYFDGQGRRENKNVLKLAKCYVICLLHNCHCIIAMQTSAVDSSTKRVIAKVHMHTALGPTGIRW